MNSEDKNLKNLSKTRDEDIDLSDITEMTGEEQLIKGKFYRGDSELPTADRMYRENPSQLGKLVPEHISTCNLDGGSLPRGELQPIPDYHEPAISAEQEKRLKDALGNHVLDYRLTFNQILVQFGGDNSESLAFKVAKLLRVNREMAIRLYGRHVGLDGIPTYPMWNV